MTAQQEQIVSITAAMEPNNEALEGICRQLGLLEEEPGPSLSPRS